MQDKVYIGVLDDYYGGMLTEHQQEIIRLYYDCDMSLAEVAEEMNITRQGVREVIVRSSAKLTEYELKLGLVAKIKTVSEELERVIATVTDEKTRSELNGVLRHIKEI